MTPRRSLAQLLLNWSLLMLGLITCGLGYLLLQLQLEQFSSNWERRISFELESIAKNVEYHVSQSSSHVVENQIRERVKREFRGTRSYEAYLQGLGWSDVEEHQPDQQSEPDQAVETEGAADEDAKGATRPIP